MEDMKNSVYLLIRLLLSKNFFQSISNEIINTSYDAIKSNFDSKNSSNLQDFITDVIIKIGSVFEIVTLPSRGPIKEMTIITEGIHRMLSSSKKTPSQNGYFSWNYTHCYEKKDMIESSF
ncbi:hypothetical protein L3N51_02261 [Metallosphaera sp. J1]|nr:hypothetical protein [Metallosphaera javensis (ex Hofmann et al. 2022)]